MRRETSVQVARKAVGTRERTVPSAGRGRRPTRKRSLGISTELVSKDQSAPLLAPRPQGPASSHFSDSVQVKHLRAVDYPEKKTLVVLG